MMFIILLSRFSPDDSPGISEFFLEEGAAGNTNVDALLVIDGVEDAYVSDCIHTRTVCTIAVFTSSVMFTHFKKPYRSQLNAVCNKFSKKYQIILGF